VVKEPPVSNDGATADASTTANRNQVDENQNATVSNQGSFVQ